MTKRETYALLLLIKIYYEQFETDNQAKIDQWHEALKNYELDELKYNLLKFVRDSHFPPTVSDLIPKAPMVRVIPGLDETRSKYIVETNHKPASKQVIAREGAIINKILGRVR